MLNVGQVGARGAVTSEGRSLGQTARASDAWPADALSESERSELAARRTRRLAFVGLGVPLGLIVLAHLLLNVLLFATPSEVNYGESIVYNQAARLVRGEPLYQPLGQAPYTVTAYMPLYYWLAATLQATVGPGFGPGRIATFGFGLVATALLSLLTLRCTRDRGAVSSRGCSFKRPLSR